MHVIEKPTEFLGALWLPYRRQRAELEAALQAAGPAKAIFAHADVVSTALYIPLWHFDTTVTRPQVELVRYFMGIITRPCTGYVPSISRGSHTNARGAARLSNGT